MKTQLLEYTGNQFVAELSNVVVYICLAAAILSIVYAVYIAYLFFTASDQNKRKAAKDRLIKTIASCLIIFTATVILKGLDITFNKNGLSGSFSGPEVPEMTTFKYVPQQGIVCQGLKVEYQTEGTPYSAYEWAITGYILCPNLAVNVSVETRDKNDNIIKEKVGSAGGKNDGCKYHFSGITNADIVEPSGFLTGTNVKYKHGSTFTQGTSYGRIDFYIAGTQSPVGLQIYSHTKNGTTTYYVKCCVMFKFDEIKDYMSSTPFYVRMPFEETALSMTDQEIIALDSLE